MNFAGRGLKAPFRDIYYAPESPPCEDMSKNCTKSSFKKAAVLLHGDRPHYIDHLAPLAILFNLPFFYTHKEFTSVLTHFYPHLKKQYIPLDIWDETLATMEEIITCEPKDFVEPYLSTAKVLSKKEIKLIWCPHGNSDKGEHSYFMEALKKEEHALVYGNKMIDFLKAKEAFSNLHSVQTLGNYRYLYFQRYQKPFLPKNNQKPVILYAPSWHNKEGEQQLTAELNMIKSLTSWHFLIKLHPNTLKRSDPFLLQILYQMEDLSHITLISDIPTVYPILACANLYIGDISSIGYDFLTFNKPLIFLYHKEKDHLSLGPLSLQKTGMTIEAKSSYELGQAIDFSLNHPALHEEERKRLYQYTFIPIPI